MPAFLQWRFAGNTVLDYLLFVVFVLGGWIAGAIVNAIIKGQIKKLAQKTETKLDDLVVGILGGPVVLGGFIAGLAIGAAYLSAGGGLRLTAEKGAVALGYIAGAWALFRAIDGTVQLYVQPWLEQTESKVDDVLVPIVIRVTKVIVGLFALLMALETFGMRVEPITNFLLQLGALLVAVAAVSAIWLLRSVVGGLLILFEKPFAEGDRITCGAHTGVIESIAIHQSILKMDDGVRVAIPNHEFVVTRVSLLKVAPKKESKVVEELPIKGKRASEARP